MRAGRHHRALAAACAAPLAAALAAGAWGCAPAAPQPRAPAKGAMDAAIARVFPALVRIHVVTKEHWEGREQKFEAAGSGTIISADGYVVTNHHVVGKAKWIRCTLANKDEADAKLVGTDALADIAVIKLDPATLRRPVQAFPFAEFGDSSKLKVGDPVLAMGSPLALSQSVTSGIVSNTEMVMPSLFWGWFDFKLDGEEVGTLVRWIAHDAQIYGGNSGGPLVDLSGRIVGVNEISLGLGGAIPGNLAKSVAAELIKSGEVKRSWLGLEPRPLLRGSGRDAGVLVNGVTKDSPAAKAGILAGDVILEYDSQPVQVRWEEELPAFNRLILETPLGKTVKLSLLREGQALTVEAATVPRGKAREDDQELGSWGATFRNLSALAAREFKRDSTDGVLVTSIRPGGPCGQAKPAVDERDVVVKVGDRPVKNLAELLAATDALVSDKTEPVAAVVAFERRNERLLTVVKLGPSEQEDRSPEVRKAWFPAAVQVFTRDLAEAMNLPGKKGVLVTQVYPGSAAEKAGFKLGDVLTHLDGMAIDASQPEDAGVFPALVRKYKIGTKADLTVLRDGQELKLSMELPPAPVPPRELRKHKDEVFEFTARDLAFEDKMREKWREEQQGVYVEAVERAGWAALAHMAVGDLLLAVGDVKVNDVAGLETVMKGLVAKQPKHVVFLVRRGIHTMFLEIEPDWSKRR